MKTAEKITKQLKALGNKAAAEHAQRFFKTGPGQYGEGDRFLGIRVPVLRKLAKDHRDIPLVNTIGLLQSPWHEVRLLALLIMVFQYKRGEDKTEIYRAYLDNTHRINNWDLVDVTAEHIVGAHLFERDRRPLYKLAKSKSLWERRIAIVSTFYFIRRNQFDDTLAIAGLLLNDKEDLMHKAVGWMLREVGKRDLKAEETFLLPRCKQIPRTMLRYAIERFPEPKRLACLHGTL
ncbi:MAG: DNA alkylation repair protein [Pontiellaceae bacterium]|jgi:3-methyladenine DNA glycosylase AlkD|nr:DNA alkylation repair protein [Pontiellaceae bacterium]